jgi:hypothetical protein
MVPAAVNLSGARLPARPMLVCVFGSGLAFAAFAAFAVAPGLWPTLLTLWRHAARLAGVWRAGGPDDPGD